MYGRLRNIWRATPRPVPPNTVILNESPRGKKGAKVPFTDAMIANLGEWNTPESLHALMVPRAGWINTLQDQEERKGKKKPKKTKDPECLTWGGNVVWITEIRGNFARLESLRNTWRVDTQKINFQHTPWLVHQFTAINSKGYLIKLAGGKIAYTPLMRAGNELWVKKTLVEIFPSLPLIMAIVKDGAPAWVTVTEYFLEGNQVWGWAQEFKDYILLQEGNQFPTSWKMKTIAPPA